MRKHSRAYALLLAAKLGATVEENDGGWYEFNVEAPKGMAWDFDGADPLHEFVTATPSRQRPDVWFWRDIVTRMETATLGPCQAKDCEWCADNATAGGSR